MAKPDDSASGELEDFLAVMPTVPVKDGQGAVETVRKIRRQMQDNATEAQGRDITLDIDDETYDWLMQQAVARKETISDVARSILNAHYGKHDEA